MMQEKRKEADSMANQSPQNRPNGNNNNDNRNGDRRRFSILTIVIIAVAVTLLFNSLLSNVFSAGEKQVTYDALNNFCLSSSLGLAILTTEVGNTERRAE